MDDYCSRFNTNLKSAKTQMATGSMTATRRATIEQNIQNMKDRKIDMWNVLVNIKGYMVAALYAGAYDTIDGLLDWNRARTYPDSMRDLIPLGKPVLNWTILDQSLAGWNLASGHYDRFIKMLKFVDRLQKLLEQKTGIIWSVQNLYNTL